MTNASRTRSLLSDLSAGMAQQMAFWGCDARNPSGNLLTRAGLLRVAREHSGGEGSSRYRKRWAEGEVELHSYCMGWYSTEKTGVVFVRSTGRFLSCLPGEPLEPGDYGDRTHGGAADSLLDDVRPLVGMIVDYEKRLLAKSGTTYRENCWRHYQKMPGVKSWLAPTRAVEWMEFFLSDPASTPRSRQWLREENSVSVCASTRPAIADVSEQNL